MSGSQCVFQAVIPICHPPKNYHRYTYYLNESFEALNFLINLFTNSFLTLPINKVRELFLVKVLHTSLLNSNVAAFKVLPLGSYTSMPAPSPPFKTILELVLWNVLQSCSCITPDVINVIKMPSFRHFLYLREQKEVTEG